MSTVHIFDTSRVAPRRDGSVNPRPAHAVPVNGLQPVPIENDAFVGCVICVGRPTHDPDAEKGAYPYKGYFESKGRLWELRFQGRFKQLPRGSAHKPPAHQ